ncbi:MAG: YbaK/EbsC family protein [Tissierellia bacterium]|nr:YbaK/EbsC family protein [Tissierellia bacterium]
MSIEKVREYFKQFGMEDRVMESEESSATVPLAAKALGVEEGRIAKTLSFHVNEDVVLVVLAGDVKIDNKKYKATFNTKAKMIGPDEVLPLVGHDIGGVCPFGVNEGVKVYMDESLKKYETVFPAAGSTNSMIELTIDDLYKYSKAIEWVDISKEN